MSNYIKLEVLIEEFKSHIKGELTKEGRNDHFLNINSVLEEINSEDEIRIKTILMFFSEQNEVKNLVLDSLDSAIDNSDLKLSDITLELLESVYDDV